MTEQLRLDWSTAEVRDGTLTVDLSGKPPKGWRAAFDTTSVLLSAGRWTTTVDKQTVQVAVVAPDDADRVRQLVEGAVLEANSTIVGERKLFGGEPEEDEDEDDAADDETAETSPDNELTDRFRAFAEHDEEEPVD